MVSIDRERVAALNAEWAKVCKLKRGMYIGSTPAEEAGCMLTNHDGDPRAALAWVVTYEDGPSGYWFQVARLLAGCLFVVTVEEAHGSIRVSRPIADCRRKARH